MKTTQERLDCVAMKIVERLNLKPHEVIFYKSQINMKLYRRSEILVRRGDEIFDLNNVSPFMIKNPNVVRYYVFGSADINARKSIAKEVANDLGLKLADISYPADGSAA